MFTGIVSGIGGITGLDKTSPDWRIRISCDYSSNSIDIGASISCAGICLTVIARGNENSAHWFEATASEETIARSTLGHWQTGDRINLERALKIGDELGGHIVTGHIDDKAEIVAQKPAGASRIFSIRSPHHLACYIAEKGSVALDGVSLTVNAVNGDVFEINIIPHTLQNTTWSEREKGDLANLEVDMMARYAARLVKGTEN